MTLDSALLARFEAALRSVDAAITTVWAPGLTDAEMDAITAGVDLDLPEEARTWWRWHNGVSADARPPQWDLLPSRPLFDLATVVEQYTLDRASMLDVHGVDRHLQPIGDQPWIYFDCSVEREEPVPIRVGGHGQDLRLVLPSIGELVAAWTTLIETGALTTGPDGAWEWDYDQIPPEVQQLGIY